MKKSEFKKHFFPVNLIVEGKKLLVVGGGRVALRKTRLLLDALGDITLVSPEICLELKELKEQGAINVVEREFFDTDVEDMFLAFAATNNKGVNLSVLHACKERGVLVCSVDELWTVGNFITPAILRKDDLVITVSTGGNSCKRARLVKDNFARNMELLSTSSINRRFELAKRVIRKQKEIYATIIKKLQGWSQEK